MTLANYLRMEAAVALLDGVDEPLADTVRDRMDVVWRGLSPHDIAWLNSRSEPAPVLPCAERCDYDGCKEPSVFRCDCRRCKSDGRFNSCKGHRDSALIAMKHERIYPSQSLNFVCVR